MDEKWIEQFVEMLFPEDKLKQKIDQAYELKETHLPDCIYKYRSFDKNGYSLQNLKENTVWFSDPTQFNDLYDCAFRIDLKEITKRRLSGLEGDENGVENDHERLHKEFLDLIRSKFTICSFSTRKDSMLMWAHYAKKHKGFCVQYDISGFSEKRFFRKYLFPVIYSDTLFDATEVFDRSIDQEVNALYLMRATLMKALDWAYESEWRLVFPTAVLRDSSSFLMPPISSVYLGAKISDEDKNRIMEICGGKSINIFKMQLDSSKFQMIPTPVE